MKVRYLCKRHFHALCQDLGEAELCWNQAFSQGQQALNESQFQQAERCFGAAYEIATMMLDRQVDHYSAPDIATNSLLAAQYLASVLVHRQKDRQATQALNQLHEKFRFLCRNPTAQQSFRTLLSDCLIPYLEKLYPIAHERVPRSLQLNNRVWHNSSTCYH